MSGPYKPTQREYAMENLNTQMDDQLKNRVAELNRANDENRDGRLDAADLKAQLNRIEAQLNYRISRTAASSPTSASAWC